MAFLSVVGVLRVWFPSLRHRNDGGVFSDGLVSRHSSCLSVSSSVSLQLSLLRYLAQPGDMKRKELHRSCRDSARVFMTYSFYEDFCVWVLSGSDNRACRALCLSR